MACSGSPLLTMNKYITEFIGTFFWSLTLVLAANNGAGNMAPLAVGAALMVMVYAGEHISGGHYNPAMTLALLMRNRVDRGDAIYYIVAQILAALVAAMIAVFLLNCQGNVGIRPVQHDLLCCVLAEFLGTFALVYVALNVHHGGHDKERSPLQGLSVGFALTAMMYGLGGISGGAFNPAVAMSMMVADMADWGEWWIYLIGSVLGAAAAATVFAALTERDSSKQ
jgi:aquaporin Z